jgi:hypothetical protein
MTNPDQPPTRTLSVAWHPDAVQRAKDVALAILDASPRDGFYVEGKVLLRLDLMCLLDGLRQATEEQPDLRTAYDEAVRQGTELIAERDRALERLAVREQEAERYQRERDRAREVPDEVVKHLMPVVGGDWIGRPDPAELARAAAHTIRLLQPEGGGHRG